MIGRPGRPTRRRASAGAWLLVLLGSALLGAALLPAVAPASPAAAAVRTAFSPACHQDPARSFKWRGAPLAACARCVGLEAAPLLAGLLLLALPPALVFGRTTLLGLAGGGTALLVLDAALGQGLDSWDHPALRCATGVLAGVGLAAGLVGRSEGAAPKARILRPAILGGLLAGLASSVPLLQVVNCCCFALVAAGGAFAAWVVVTDAGRDQPASRLALAGWWAGVIAAAIRAPLGPWLAGLVAGEGGLDAQVEESVRFMEEQVGDVLPGAAATLREAMRSALWLDLNLWTLACAGVSMLLFGAIGMLGGLAVSALTRRRDAGERAEPGVAPADAGGGTGEDASDTDAAPEPAREPESESPTRQEEIALDELPRLAPPQGLADAPADPSAHSPRDGDSDSDGGGLPKGGAA